MFKQDLDMLAQQLNQLGGQQEVPPPAAPASSAAAAAVFDDDSSDDDDDDGRVANDGTLLASDPPKPLLVYIYNSLVTYTIVIV